MLIRYITAVVLIIILVVLTQVPVWITVLICQGISFIALYEWTKITKQNDLQQGLSYLFFSVLTIFIIAKYIGVLEELGIFGVLRLIPFLSVNNISLLEKWLIILGGVFWLTYVPFALYKKSKITTGFKAKAFGVFIIASCISAIVYLVELSPEHLFVAILIPIIADIFAFLVGRYFGAIKLTIISPNKTLEGFVAGMLAVVIIGGWMLSKFIGLGFLSAIFIALIVGLSAVCGDLFESLAKRWSGVKDSGKILPGHGGILDRVDSYLAAIPVYGFLLILFR